MMPSASLPGIGPSQSGAAAFRLTPDVKFLFLAAGHATAAAALRAARDAGRRLIALCGEPGTGKTTLLTQLRSEARANAAIAYCPYPALSPAPMLQDFLGGPDAAATLELDPDAIAARLAAAHAGRRLVLIVDDATRSPPRLLVDLCRVAERLATVGGTLQIVLATNVAFCQELDRGLAEAGMPPAATIELEPMTPAETGAYVRHRLGVAGLPADLFTDEAVAEIARHAAGTARVVNQICSRALMLSEWRREQPISAALVAEAVEDCPIDALVAAHAAGDLHSAAPAAASTGTPSSEPARTPQSPAEAAVPPDVAVMAPSAAPIDLPSEPPSESEIGLPPPPSQARSAPEHREALKRAPKADEATLPRLPRRPVSHPSWRLREIARERRLAQAHRLIARPPDQPAPRYAGFVARKAQPAAKTEPAPPPATRSRRPARAFMLVVAVLAGGAGAAILLRPDLAPPVAELLAPMRQTLARSAEDPRAALDRLLELIRPAYDLERSPRS